MNRRRGGLLALVAAFAISLYGCARPSSRPPEPATVTGLAVAQVRRAQIPLSIDVVGTVRARESAVLSSEIMGRITSVLVREGDRVRAGQLVVALDGAQAASEIQRSRANLSSSAEGVKMAETDSLLAKSTLARYQLLRDRKSVSPQEFDEVQHRSESASARLESSRSMMLANQAADASTRTIAGYGRLHAPFSGIVTARHVDPGTMATPGMPLLEVDKTGPLQLLVTIDESLLSLVHKGMQVPTTIDPLSGQSLQGRVADIVPAADPSSHSFLVKIDLAENAHLRTGMFGTAAIETRMHSALLVPQSALVTHGSLNSVWILDQNGIASLRYLTIGAKHEANFEVLSGLSAGETVVLSPGDRELGGKRIEARQ